MRGSISYVKRSANIFLISNHTKRKVFENFLMTSPTWGDFPSQGWVVASYVSLSVGTVFKQQNC